MTGSPPQKASKKILPFLSHVCSCMLAAHPCQFSQSGTFSFTILYYKSFRVTVQEKVLLPLHIKNAIICVYKKIPKKEKYLQRCYGASLQCFLHPFLLCSSSTIVFTQLTMKDQLSPHCCIISNPCTFFAEIFYRICTVNDSFRRSRLQPSQS